MHTYPDIPADETDSSDAPVGFHVESTDEENRRQCVRLSAFEREQVVLTDGFTRITARCVDRSAGGFGMECDESIPWTVGETLVLNRCEGSYEVRVAYIRQRDEEDEEGTEDQDHGKYRIGLKCVRDFVAPPRTTPVHLLQGWLRRHRFFKVKGETISVCFALMLCAAIVAVIFLPISPLNSRRDWLRDLVSFGRAETPLTVVSGRQSKATKRPTSEPKQVVSDDRWSRILSSGKPVAWSDIEGMLQLTKEQSEKLAVLLNDVFTADRTVRDNAKAAGTNGSRDFAAALESLSDDTLSFLSDEQRGQLESLLAQVRGK